MGSAVSAVFIDEATKATASIDGADVSTPRNQSAVAEVARLRGLLRSQAFLDPETGHLHTIGGTAAAIPLSPSSSSSSAAAAAAAAGQQEGGAAGAEDVWERVTDPDTKTLYYYNWATGASSWEAPPGFVEPEGDVDSSLTAESSQTSNAKRHLWAVLRSTSTMTKWDGAWTLFTDPRTGSSFYYNTETGVSAWEKPSKEEEEAQRQQAASAWQCVLSPQGEVLYYYNFQTGESTYDTPEAVQKTNEELEAEQAAYQAEWDAYYAEQQEAISSEMDSLKQQIVEKDNLSAEAQAKLDEVLAESAKLEANNGGDDADQDQGAAKVKALTENLDANLQKALEQVNAEREKKKSDLQARLESRKKAREQALARKRDKSRTALHPAPPSGAAPPPHVQHLSNVLFGMSTKKEPLDMTKDGHRWHKAVHDKTGVAFFFNQSTKKIQWEAPAGEGGE